MTQIVVAGEGLVDMIDGRVLPGGAPLNAAVGMARLGLAVAWLGAVGDDDNGRRITDHAAAAGVDLSLVQTVAAPTSRAVVTITDGQPSYRFEIEAASLGLASLQLPATDHGALVVVAGAIGFHDAPLGTSLASLVRTSPAPVWLDPNLRPRAVDDAATYAATLDDLAARATVVKTSDEDVRLLYGAHDPMDVAQRWLESGTTLVVLSRGAAGLVGLRRGHPPIVVPAVRVEVVDTVGAGDTVTAALVSWAARHDCLDASGLDRLSDADVADALAFAATAAAITCGRRGADPPTLDEVTAAR